MKITSGNPLPPVSPTSTPEARPVERAESPSGGTRVSLSGDAKWIAAVAEEARRAPAIREDVVARTKQALADGTWDAQIDLDAVVDRFLADL
jgi:hypothetical protein